MSVELESQVNFFEDYDCVMDNFMCLLFLEQEMHTHLAKHCSRGHKDNKVLTLPVVYPVLIPYVIYHPLNPTRCDP